MSNLNHRRGVPLVHSDVEEEEKFFTHYKNDLKRRARAPPCRRRCRVDATCLLQRFEGGEAE